MAVKGLDGGLEEDRQLERIEVTGFVSSGFGKTDLLLFQALPEIAEHRHLAAGMEVVEPFDGSIESHRKIQNQGRDAGKLKSRQRRV